MVKKVKYMINYLIKADIVFVNSEDTYNLAHETLDRNTETKKKSLIGR